MDWTHTTAEKLFGSFGVLSESDVEEIFQSALQLLESTGMQFDDTEALDLFRSHGASVDGNRVRIPRQLATERLQQLPRDVVLGSRDPAFDLPLGRKRFATTNGFGTMRILEPDGVTTRPATAMDLAKLTRMADDIDEVGYCQHQTTPQDVPTETLDVLQAFAVLTNTSKHAHLSTYSSDQLDLIFELGDIAGEGRPAPVFSLGCCSVSPLRYYAEATQTLIRSAERGIPFLVVCGAIAGISTPVTLAGTLAVQTAEHVAAVVLAQLVNPGTPIVLGSFASPMDPRTGMQRLAAAELALVNGATAQLSRRLGAPFGYGTGGVSDSTLPGVQAGIEKAFAVLSCALSGVEVIHDAVSGILAAGTVTSYEQMIIDAELCGLVRRYVRGIEVSEETLALPWIEQVGPGGAFPATPHTAKHFRQEIHLSDLWESATTDEVGILERALMTVDRHLGQDVRCELSRNQVEAMIKTCGSVGLEGDVLRELVPSNE